ncbi:hypothetical protein P3T39_006722 [Kitasatospora sp. GP82]|nr:hypothetical protein [Kitasatospora sp. GP82]
MSWASPDELHPALRGESHDCDWQRLYIEQAAEAVAAIRC